MRTGLDGSSLPLKLTRNSIVLVRSLLNAERFMSARSVYCDRQKGYCCEGTGECVFNPLKTPDLNVDKDAVVRLIELATLLGPQRQLKRQLGLAGRQLAGLGNLHRHLDELHRLDGVVKRLKQTHVLRAELQAK